MSTGGKKKFRAVIKERPQSDAAIVGRGASWSPANRFEKMHVDLTDVDVIDPDPGEEKKPRRATQYFRDATKTIIAHNQSPDNIASRAAASDRKSTRLNSSHQIISYAVFCLKKKIGYKRMQYVRDGPV